MGSPELPNDPGDDNLRTTNIVHHPPGPSDDSDNDSVDGADYEGYQPLPMDDHHNDLGHTPLDIGVNDNTVYNMEDSNSIQENRDFDLMASAIVHVDPNLPRIETADVQIEREVWNSPRPQELQIELDGNRTQQILSAMANFQLPNLAVPDWAAGVPEERWKEELLQRIRQRKPANDNTKMEVDRESK